MKANVRFIIHLLPFLVVYTSSRSQEIKNDTIYASATQQTTLLFPSRITTTEYSDENAYARFSKRVEEGKVVYLTAKFKNAAPAILNIIEGRRNHVFIIVYKDQLALQELEHNWRKLRELKSHVAELMLKPIAKEEPAIAITQQAPAVQPDTIKPEPAAAEIKEDYNKVLLDAYKLFDKKEYAGSKKRFEVAALIRPGEKIAKNKIEEINAILDKNIKAEAIAAAIKQKEENYQKNKKLADKALNDRSYEEAEANYKLALGFKPKDPLAQKGLMDARYKLAEIAYNRKVRAVESDYLKNIALGKTALEGNQLEDAKAAFQVAAAIKPGDVYARNQVKFITKKIADQDQQARNEKLKLERKAAYDEAISAANNAFTSRNYMVAVEQYRKALIIQDDPYPSSRLQSIEKLLADSAQKLSSERARLLKEKKAADDYRLYIAKADKSFGEKDYAGARMSYNQALKIKDDPYPKSQLTEIGDMLKRVDEEANLKKSYEQLITKAKAALNTSDYNNSRKYFEEALIIKPGDDYAQRQLDVVYKKLDDVAKENAVNEKYKLLLARAAQASGNMPVALEYYKEARTLKPAETGPPKMIQQLENAIAKQDADLARAKRMRDEQEMIKRKSEVTSRADAAILDKKWEDAKTLYKELLSLNPSPTEQDFAKRKIGSIDLELNRIAARTPVKKDTVVAAVKKKGRGRKSKVSAVPPPALVTQEPQKEINAPALTPEPVPVDPATPAENSADRLQKDAIVYSRELLTKKYPGVHFDELPPGQTFNTAGRKNRSQFFQQSSAIINSKPVLNFYDSINQVKVICQAITFDGTAVYLKLLIQNFSAGDDFVTGAMQLKLSKKNGGSKDLNQLFISDFPVVMPGKEFTVIYVTDAARSVDRDDNLVLELNDRLKKLKLNVKIPGDVYNQQRLLAKK